MILQRVDFELQREGSIFRNIYHFLTACREDEVLLLLLYCCCVLVEGSVVCADF